MQLTGIIMLAACLQVSAAAFGQKVTIIHKQVSLKEVFNEIRRQTDYNFIYSNRIIREARPVSVNVKNTSVKEVLKKVFAGQPLTYTIEDKLIIVKKKPRDRLPAADHVQDKIVSGMVTDKAGTRLIGVTVREKGTANGTATDKNGRYILPVNNLLDTLVFSYVGYQELEMPIKGETEISVQLEAATKSMNEIVVVGRSNKQTKRSITGAIATISSEKLKQSPVANLSNALAGRLPGLFSVQSSGQPGDDAANLYIRGISTYGPNKSPLIVIDGLPRTKADFRQLDPNEIESVSILKDATSTALYGIQGANGVIVVTTRRGTIGGPRINFTAQYANQHPVRLPILMSSYQKAKFYDNVIARNDGDPPQWDEEQLNKFKDQSDPYLYPDINWYRAMLKNSAPQQHYNLNVNGGTQKIRYFISGSYINQGSLIRYQDKSKYGVKYKFDRYNFRSNVDLSLSRSLQLKVDLAGRLETRQGPGPGYSELFSQINSMGGIPYITPMLNPDGSIGAGSAVKKLTGKNPYGLVTQSGYYKEFTNVMYGTLGAHWSLDAITQGLSIQGTFSFQDNNFKRTLRSADFDSYWYRGVDDQNNAIYEQQTVKSNLKTSGSANITRNHYLDFRIDYNRAFGRHGVKAQILANRTLKVINDQLPYAYQGISSQFLYSFDRKYYAEVNIGYNGSENFPKGRRYGFFPAFSAGWIINEDFFKQADFLNLLKLRASYGFVGNDQIGGARWLYLSDYTRGGDYRFGVNPKQNAGGFNESTIGNPDVTWERSSKANIGIDASLFDNKIKVTYNVFRQLRRDILTTPEGTIPGYGGFGDKIAPRNTGEVLNRGMEGEVSYDGKIGAVGIFVKGQVSFAKNKVLENDQAPPKFPYQDLRGYPVGTKLAYKSLGLFQSQDEINKSADQSSLGNIIPGSIKFKDANGDGVIDPFDRIPILVNGLPPYAFGFTLEANYKGFDLSVLFNGAHGGVSYISARSTSKIYLYSWSEDNTPEENANAKVPVLESNSDTWAPSDFWVQSSDYLKLRNAEIGYTLPHSWLEILKIKNARVYVNGQNLAIWDKLIVKDRDPESPSGNSNLVYPIQRIINVGINIQF